MKKFLHNIKQEAGHIRMSVAEKVAMKAAVFGAVSSVPVQSSPYVFASLFSYNMRMSLAGLLLFVLAGSGTVSAAQGALPGDILYPIKLAVNEKVEVALASNASAKAEVQVRLAGRRVEEAQTLAAQGRLDEKTANLLTDDFNEHASLALAESETEDSSADVEITLSAKEPQTPASARTVMMTTLSVNVPEPAQSTTTQKQEKFHNEKTAGQRGALRESLREKEEILKELKTRSQRQEIRDGEGEERDTIKVELQFGR